MSKSAATRQFGDKSYGNNEICDFGVIRSSESNRINESQVNPEFAEVFSSMNYRDVTTNVQKNNNNCNNNNCKKKKKKKNKKHYSSIKYKAAIAIKARRMYDKKFGCSTNFNNVHPPFDNNNELSADDPNVSDDIVIDQVNRVPPPSTSTSTTSHVSAATSDIVPEKETMTTTNEKNKNSNEISKSYDFNIYVQNGTVSEIPGDQSCNVNVQNESQEIRVNKSMHFDELSEEEKTDPLFIAIIDNGYPNVEPITSLHFQSLDQAIQMKLDRLKCHSFVPRFEYAYIKNKSVIVKCADEPSKHWLMKNITKIHPWPTARLKPVSMSVIDNANYDYIAGKTTLFLHSEESAITVLYRLQKQNPQLDMGCWNISTEKVFKSGYNGFLIHFGIPFSSMKVLESMEFRLFLGMRRISMNVKLLS